MINKYMNKNSPVSFDFNYKAKIKNKLMPISMSIIDFIRKNRDKKIFICGNGGSACNAIHFAEDLQSQGIRALHLCDIGFLTATANDFGYDYVFTRPLKIWADGGDLLITLSCSGASKNIVKAIEWSKLMSLKHIAFPANKETMLTTPETENVHSQIIHEVYMNLKNENNSR